MEKETTLKPRTQLALRTQFSIGNANNIILEKINTHIKTTGLTATQFAIIDILGNYGPLKISEIYKRMLIKSGNRTMIIDSIEDKNLIKRIFSKNDRREIIIELTAEGQKFFNENLFAYTNFVENMMSALNQNEQRELNSLLNKLSDNI